MLFKFHFVFLLISFSINFNKIFLFQRMLLAGYMSAVQMQAKSAQEYDLQMETKKGAKKRSLHRGGRMWLSPPRLFLVTIPSDVSFTPYPLL